MTEEERIESIKRNGGTHLKNFKTENKTYAMCLAAVQSTSEALWYVPPEMRTEEIYQEACKHGGMVLSRVPAEFINETICEYAVVSEGSALQYVPDELKTRDICMKAAVSSSQAYWFIPLEYITAQFVAEVAKKSSYESISSLPDKLKKNVFYFELVSQDPEFVFYIPRKALTAKIGKATIHAMGYDKIADAVKARPELLSRLHTSLYDYETCLNFINSEFFRKASTEEHHWGGKMYGFNTETDEDKGRLYIYPNYTDTYSLPDMMKWPDVVEAIVKLNGYYLKFAKPEIINIDICMAAIEGNAHIFKDIPEQYKTREVCELAFQKEPFNIEYFPAEFITPELVLRAVKHSGFILQHLPEKYKTKEICLVAVSDEGNGKIESVPNSVIDKDICLAWLQNSKWVINPLDKIPQELWDYDICLAAVKLDGSELERIPSDWVTYELCLAAVKKDSHAAKYVPRQMFSQEMAYIMVEHTYLDFKLIPAEFLNEDICLKAISHGDRYAGTVLGDIPKEIITQTMCNEAVAKSAWSLKSVPECFVTEEMLIQVAKTAPGRLCDNFPERFRTKETIAKMIVKAPDAESYLKRFIE